MHQSVMHQSGSIMHQSVMHQSVMHQSVMHQSGSIMRECYAPKCHASKWEYHAPKCYAPKCYAPKCHASKWEYHEGVLCTKVSCIKVLQKIFFVFRRTDQDQNLARFDSVCRIRAYLHPVTPTLDGNNRALTFLPNPGLQNGFSCQ